MATPARSTGALMICLIVINKYFKTDSIGERRPSIPMANSDSSMPNAARTRRMSMAKAIDTRPKHLILGDFELANVV